MLANLSTHFVSLPAKQLDIEIEEAQRQVCECLGLDVSLLWQISPDNPDTMFVTHRHLPPDFPPLPEVLDRKKAFPWAMERALRGETIILNRLTDVPPEAVRDAEVARSLGAKSLVTFPLTTGGRPTFGVLNFTATRKEQDWSSELVSRLQLVAQVFANAIARKHDEQALRDSEERLTLATSAADAGLWMLNAAGTRIWGNAKIMELFGLPTADDLEVERVPALVHPEDRDRALEALVRARRSTEMSILDCRIVRPDGSVRWMHLRGRLVAGASDEPARLMGIAADVTVRKEMEMQLRQTLEEVQRLRDQLQQENVYLREKLRRDDDHHRIVGESKAIRKMLSQAERVATTDTAVLITGETGTGKELLAQAIHDMSGRSKKTMVMVNCAALPPALIESELFGREKGAYTGAMSRQTGRFELADGSTLFLDEIGDLSLDLQVKLLRVLQDGRFERLGSNHTLTLDVRVIAATNKDLRAMIRDGRFREDLFHRLDVYPIEVPPLRDRVTDIPLLVWKFVREFNKKMGKSIDSIPRQTMERLKQYHWPGNVRELRNLVERGMIVCDGRSLTIDHPADAREPTSLPVTLEAVERKHICEVLDRVHWRISGKHGAAEILGLLPTTLHSRMKKLGISRPRP
ncbi:MAG: sigma 54-interacting transcriptional regulator [Candidatus Deferrimicrobiaceae bacterium]